MTHPVFLANAGFAAWIAERDALADRRDSLNRQKLAARRADDQADEKDKAAVLAAVEAGLTIPKPAKRQDWAHLDAAEAIQRQAEQAHRDRRNAVLVEAAETGAWQGLQDRERGRNAHLGPILEELAMIVAESQSDGRAAVDMIAARDQIEGRAVRPSRAERMNARPSMVDILEAAQQERSLLDPEEMPEHLAREPKIMTDPGADESGQAGLQRALAGQSSLGYQNGGRFGNYDARRGIDARSNLGKWI